VTHSAGQHSIARTRTGKVLGLPLPCLANRFRFLKLAACHPNQGLLCRGKVAPKAMGLGSKGSCAAGQGRSNSHQSQSEWESICSIGGVNGEQQSLKVMASSFQSSPRFTTLPFKAAVIPSRGLGSIGVESIPECWQAMSRTRSIQHFVCFSPA